MLIYNLPLGDKFRIYFIEELEYLNDLEKDYGLLSSIGIKIALPKRRNDNGLEVFIKHQTILHIKMEYSILL